MIDNHHKIQYGLSAILAAALAGVYTITPATKTTWPALTAGQVAQIVNAAAPLIGDKPLAVYCMDSECAKIEKAIANGAKAAKIKYHTERPLFMQDGVTTGAPTQADADTIAKAVETATAGALQPKAIPKQQEFYIGFGRFVGE